MKRTDERLPGLDGLALLRHALSDLRFRPGKSLLSIFSVTVAVVYFLLLSYYGHSLYRYQQSLLERGLPNRVEARGRDATDPRQRFTEERQDELRSRPGVRNVSPRIEIGVKAWLPAGTPASLSAEGTVEGDDALAPHRLCLGRTVAGPDSREAVLPRRVFEQLGGTVDSGSLSPSQLRLEVKRTTGGQTEVQTLLLAVVGLLDEPVGPRVYIPLRLAEQLDQWCSHQIEQLPAPGGRLALPRLASQTLRAYGPVEHQARVAQEVSELQVDVLPLATFTAFEQRLVSYEVRLRDKDDPRDVADVAAALALARPTFTFASPHVRVEVRVAGRRLPLEASTPADPRRFEVGLRHGRWLAADDRVHEVLLPAEVVQQVFPRTALAECVGREVEVHCERERGVSDADTIRALRCRLAGVVDGPTGFTSLDWLRGIALWRQGKVLYNESSSTFETPVEVYRRSGYLRCNIDLADAESARAMVNWLETRGYQVEHRLAEREGLRKLARVLVCLVLLFVFGFGTCSFLTVLISNALHLASKTYEIGILRALGLSGRQIVGLFVIQGLLTGLAAFVLAGAIVLAGEPFVSELARSTFRLPAPALPVPLAHRTHAWLFVLALGLAVLATTLGAVLPALRAARLTPVQAMQRQD